MLCLLSVALSCLIDATYVQSMRSRSLQLYEFEVLTWLFYVWLHDVWIALMQENMTRMLMVSDVQDIIKRHQAQIITSLKDPDIRLV